ncbi:uncharacterized protein YjdB [Clostridium saccharoperbutylacetonicum]|uniref:Bacterial surface protein containing Ig-like domain n=1 Tax=Clostridium saccharoperbutylacetonicum N1-4(HMT) TaxID=931276 RepID=M1MYP6_9CLOT|nr:Ig-like domain-containing protein [Clostridium saccharoperbutylacetonicum]AGF56532.1 bacterial surface protein containing Ig-like domain [Clostridium saccharoperbutylacetonicum N1-4(HMT)]NRT62717.1 uncharacterized protein YjdB [Clostridium saccharoperbutylacetonicum]NSB26068.1 uncharacterized protein YjdB [Clostridium saccharoperbutylacetonicum]NSB45423.1 uncharacterized protein YjdB [Clostridium saccharoperbutylacetonicum]
MINYFKKFSIIFMMAFMFIGIEMIQNGSVANAATDYTRGVQYLNPLEGFNRFDDSDGRITYSSNFKEITQVEPSTSSTSSLYNKNRMDLSNSAGDGTIKFSFYGTDIALIDCIANNRTQNCTISFDGGNTNEIFTSYSSSYSPTSAIAQSAFYVKKGLENKRHDVIISIPASSTTWFCIDAIDINGYLLYNNESITLDKSTINLTEGDSDKLTAITTPSAVGATWTSSDPSIATIEVDPTNGKLIKVNAIKEGTCTITATTADGSNLSASCTINVTKKDVPKPDNPTTDTKTGAILIINLTDGETKVFDVSSSEVDKFKSWYNNKSEFENKLTYIFNKTVNSNISVEEDVVHNQITSFEIRKY